MMMMMMMLMLTPLLLTLMLMVILMLMMMSMVMSMVITTTFFSLASVAGPAAAKAWRGFRSHAPGTAAESSRSVVPVDGRQRQARPRLGPRQRQRLAAAPT